MGLYRTADLRKKEIPKRSVLPLQASGNAGPQFARPYGRVFDLQKRLGNDAVQRFFKAGLLQAKLSVGEPDDPHEQEADRIADAVLRMPDSDAGRLYRQAPEEEDEKLQMIDAPARKGIKDEDEATIKRSPSPAASKSLLQRDLAIPAPHPAATARKLSEAEITAAIDYNSKHFKDPKSLEEIRDVVGISPTPAVSDRELALTVAQWQAEFGLGVDGKAGDATVGTIVRELKAEKEMPAGLNLLLDYHRDKPAGRATLNYLPVLHDAVPTDWGVTTEDDPVFDISVYARADGWHCVITKADQQCHQGVRLLPGVVEVTPALVSGENNNGRLQTMATSLNSVANQGADSGYYMINAVQAHENVHITQYRSALAPHYLTLKAAIEALTVPLASRNTAADAKAAIKALPAYTVAMAAFHAADVAANNATASHPSMAPFNAAEHGVVDPMIATINLRRVLLAMGFP